MVSPLHLILCSSPMLCLCYLNQYLKCRVVKQLEPYVCVGISIPLNFDKLHCILIAMSCIPSHAHADSFSVVVSIASVVCCSVLLLRE
jgi:hypothetical protein